MFSKICRHEHGDHHCCCGGGGCGCHGNGEHHHEHEHSGTCGCGCGPKSEEAQNLEVPFILISLAALLASFGISYFKIHFPGFPLSDPAWIAVILCGIPLIKAGFTNLFVKRKITSSLLISVAILASLALQFFMTFSGGGNVESHHESYIFAAGEIAFLMALGEWLEDRTVKKAKAGIENLIKISPKKALRECDGKTEEIDVEALQIGDFVRVRPNDSIPADGEIVDGNSSVNQANMTGESLPIDKTVGDLVFAGTQNLTGSLLVKVSKKAEDTAIARLIRYVKNAEQKKAPIQRTADKWASKVVPAAIVLSILVFVFANFILDVGAKEAVIRGVTILVVFCPCAFALATPPAVASGIGNGGNNWILVKSC